MCNCFDSGYVNKKIHSAEGNVKQVVEAERRRGRIAKMWTCDTDRFPTSGYNPGDFEHIQ
jgi:hypothetical protein